MEIACAARNRDVRPHPMYPARMLSVKKKESLSKKSQAYQNKFSIVSKMSKIPKISPKCSVRKNVARTLVGSAQNGLGARRRGAWVGVGPGGRVEVGRGETLGSAGWVGLGPNWALLAVGTRARARGAHAIAAKRCQEAAMLRCAHTRAHHPPTDPLLYYHQSALFATLYRIDLPLLYIIYLFYLRAVRLDASCTLRFGTSLVPFLPPPAGSFLFPSQYIRFC